MRTVQTILCLLIVAYGTANTIHVGKDLTIRTLKQGLAAAKPGDTVLLHNGTYKEGNLIVDKGIFLLGVDTPVLDGDHKHEILTITGKDVVVKNIHFVNAGYSSMNDFAAIKIIDAVNVLIESNFVSNSSFAIHIANSIRSTIRNNIIKGTNKSEHSSGNGIHLWKCDNMTINGNAIGGHRDGIYLEFVTHSVVSDNVSEKNIRYGLHFMFSHNDSYINNTFRNNGAGVAVMYSKQVIMERNLFDRNWGASAYGILLKDISDSHISNNRFIKNTIAIHMEGSSRIEISKNIFNGNGWALKVQASCDDNKFYYNNFYGNTFDIATNGTRTLNRFKDNYWDKYEGYDLNKDGTGDVPYHPVSMYSMIVEQNPNTLMLLRSFMVTLLDKAERAIPSLTPENLVDLHPRIKPNKL